MNSPSHAFDHAYKYRLQGARQFKAAGGKVAGFVSTAVPVELITAAGMYPVMITGDCNGSTALANEWMEDMFDPMARAIFQAALAGELDFLDVLIIPRSADSFLRLYLYLREIERLGVCKHLPRVVLYDLLQTPWPSSSKHNVAQLHKLRVVLGDIVGREASDTALRAAVDVGNQNRALLRELLDRRRTTNVRGELFLKAITTRYFMPIEQHSAMLQALLNETAASSIVKPRIVVAGNAQDNPALHQLLDSQGFHIVGDYHWLGDSCCEHDIELRDNDDPWLAVSEHYHMHSLTSRRFPHAPHEIVEHAKRCNAQGVVFYLFEPEEALTWDSPNQVRALAAAGIESLVLENQPYVIAPSTDIAASLSAFATRLTNAAA